MHWYTERSLGMAWKVVLPQVVLDMGQAGFAEAKPKLSAEERGNSIVICFLYLNSWRVYFLENPIFKKWMITKIPLFQETPKWS